MFAAPRSHRALAVMLWLGGCASASAPPAPDGAPHPPAPQPLDGAAPPAPARAAVTCGGAPCSDEAPMCCAPSADQAPSCDTAAGCDAGKPYRVECHGRAHCGGGVCQVSITGKTCVAEIAYPNAAQACESQDECGDACAAMGSAGTTTCSEGACTCE